MSKEVAKIRAAVVDADTDAVSWPYVEFEAIKFVHQPDGNFKEELQLVKFPVKGNLNSRAEVMDYYRKKGWQIVGYGNLEATEAHRELAEYCEMNMRPATVAKPNKKAKLGQSAQV